MARIEMPGAVIPTCIGEGFSTRRSNEREFYSTLLGSVRVGIGSLAVQCDWFGA